MRAAAHSYGTYRRALAIAVLIASLMMPSALIAAPALAAPTDNTPPVIDLTYSNGRLLENGTLFGSGDITITCISLDEMSNITEVGYSIDGSGFKSATSVDGLYRTRIILTGLDDGNHTLLVKVTNNASLTAEKNVTFEVDYSSGSLPSESAVWAALGFMIAISGIGLAVFAFLKERKDRPMQDEGSTAPEELPPIL